MNAETSIFEGARALLLSLSRGAGEFGTSYDCSDAALRGCSDRQTSCSLLKIENGTAELIRKVSLLLPEEVDLTKATVIGRDKELHVFSNDDWYVFSIDSLS